MLRCRAQEMFIQFLHSFFNYLYDCVNVGAGVANEVKKRNFTRNDVMPAITT